MKIFVCILNRIRAMVLHLAFGLRAENVLPAPFGLKHIPFGLKPQRAGYRINTSSAFDTTANSTL